MSTSAQMVFKHVVVLSCLSKYTTSWELLYDLLMTYTIDLVTFCNMWSSKWLHLMPFDHLKFQYKTHSYQPPTTFHPYRSACGNDYVRNKQLNIAGWIGCHFLKMTANSASYLCKIWSTKIPCTATDISGECLVSTFLPSRAKLNYIIQLHISI